MVFHLSLSSLMHSLIQPQAGEFLLAEIRKALSVVKPDFGV